jgi:hypothetical protein
MFITGFALKLKIKKVDRILLEKGYSIEECEIYYSPITSWFVTLFMMLPFLYPFLFIDFDYLFLSFIYPLRIYILSYFLLGYFLIRYFNNTPVLVKNELIIINAYFPFQSFKIYQIEEIQKVKIDKLSPFFPSWLFLLFSINYVEVYVKNNKKRIYCPYLEVDCYDENWTEKTMDDFKYSLFKEGVTIEFGLD